MATFPTKSKITILKRQQDKTEKEDNIKKEEAAQEQQEPQPPQPQEEQTPIESGKVKANEEGEPKKGNGIVLRM